MQKTHIFGREMFLAVLLVMMFFQPVIASMEKPSNEMPYDNELILKCLVVNEGLASSRRVVGSDSMRLLEEVRAELDPLIFEKVQSKLEKTLDESDRILSENKRILKRLMLFGKRNELDKVLEYVMERQNEVLFSLQDINIFNEQILDYLDSQFVEEDDKRAVSF